MIMCRPEIKTPGGNLDTFLMIILFKEIDIFKENFK